MWYFVNIRYSRLFNQKSLLVISSLLLHVSKNVFQINNGKYIFVSGGIDLFGYTVCMILILY